MSIKVIPVDIFQNIVTDSYDQTKTSRIGRITNKTLEGVTAMGPPIVQYRNTAALSEAITPNELHFTDNGRIFISTTEVGGLVNIALYNIDTQTNGIAYVGKIIITVLDTPATTHTIRGFRVDDTGTTGWSIFWLSTATQAANAGLYMAKNLALADFQPVAPTIPTATGPGQKAVYKLEDTVHTMTTAAGLSLDKTNKFVYVHAGVSASHYFYKFDYNATLSTVTAGGITKNAYLYTTGLLPALSGTLLLTNSEEYHIPAIGANTGLPCVIFSTTTFMYRGQLSELTNGGVTWPSLEFQNNNPGTNLITAENTSRCTFSDDLKRVILLTSNNVFIVKQFMDNTSDFYTVIEGRDNDENAVKEMYNFRVGAVQGIDARNGMVAILSTTTGQRGLYVANFKCNDVFGSTKVISPVIDVTNDRLLRVTVGLVRQDKAAPVNCYYRTSGFGSETGGWILLPSTLTFNGSIGIVSPTNQVQIMQTYSVFNDDKTNPTQMNSWGIIAQSENSISDNWEYSHDDSTNGNPSIMAFRLKKVYASAVPSTLTARAFDLSGNLYNSGDVTTNAVDFEYSTDQGVNWLPLGTIPNVVGTMVRYTIPTPPGIDIRPSLRES